MIWNENLTDTDEYLISSSFDGVQLFVLSFTKIVRMLDTRRKSYTTCRSGTLDSELSWPSQVERMQDEDLAQEDAAAVEADSDDPDQDHAATEAAEVDDGDHEVEVHDDGAEPAVLDADHQITEDPETTEVPETIADPGRNGQSLADGKANHPVDLAHEADDDHDRKFQF